MSLRNLYESPEFRQVSDLTVADGQTTSGALRLYGNVPVAIVPTSSGAIAAATVSFQASLDGTNWNNIDDRDLQSQYNVAIAKDRYEALKAENFLGAPFIRVVLVSAQSGASAVIKIITAPY